MTPELSRELAKIFNTTFFQTLPFSVRSDILAHVEKVGTLDGLDPWLAHLLGMGRAELAGADKALAVAGDAPVIVEDDANADWLITLQKQRKAKDGTPTDLELEY